MVCTVSTSDGVARRSSRELCCASSGRVCLRLFVQGSVAAPRGDAGVVPEVRQQVAHQHEILPCKAGGEVLTPLTQRSIHLNQRLQRVGVGYQIIAVARNVAIHRCVGEFGVGSDDGLVKREAFYLS